MNKDKGIWQIVDPKCSFYTRQYRVASFISRSNAFPAASGQWLIVSPSSQSTDLPKAEGAPTAGNPKAPCLVLPNAFHFLGYSVWKEKYPQAQGYAPEGALPRLIAKGCKDLQPLSQLPDLHPGCSWVELPGLRYGEAWFRILNGAANTWITGDVFFNLRRFSKKPIARLTQKLMGSAPGLKLPNTIKYVLIKKRKVFLDFLEKLLREDQPTRLLPLHGEILDDPELPKKLTALLRERLGANF